MLTRAYLIIFGVIFAPFVNSQTIYDSANTFNTELVESCDISATVAAQTAQIALSASYNATCSNPGDVCFTGKYLNVVNDEYASYCRVTVQGKATEKCTVWSSSTTCTTNFTTVVTTGSPTNVYKTQVETCPPENQPSYTYMTQDSVGTNQCYDPAELSQLSDCPSFNVLPVSNNTSDSVCVTKDDGSQCQFNKQTENGQTFYQQSIEPLTCFNDLTQYNDSSVVPPNNDSCTDIGGGSYFCDENPSNVCTNASDYSTCISGCGTVNGVFGCFSGDTDQDTIPDYLDPDIDGDGIANETDLDADGDGVDDEIDPLQQQTGDIIVNVDTPTANEIGTAVGQQLENKLIETFDFDADKSNSIALIDAKLNEITQQSTDFIGSTETNLTDSINRNNVSQIDSLANSFSNSTCTDFNIPIVNQPLSLCEHAPKVQTFLYFIFALTTAWYCFQRILSTARGV